MNADDNRRYNTYLTYAAALFLAVFFTWLIFFSKNQPAKQVTPRIYKATLYNGGIAVREWQCDSWYFASYPVLYSNGREVARINGTYVIEEVRP